MTNAPIRYTPTDNAPVLGGAWRYSVCGLAVLPLVFRNKKAIRGFLWSQVQAPQSLDEIELLFPPTPPRNVGIICGAPSGGLVVVDIDGRLALEEVLSARPELAGTWIVKTGRTEPGPGYHAYVRASGPVPTITGAFTKVLGVEIKAKGSIVVAPPSIHQSGQQYDFERGTPEAIVEVGDSRAFIDRLLAGLGFEKP